MKLNYTPPVHRGRGPQQLKKIPPQESPELKLKNRVSSKNPALNNLSCEREVLALIGCIQSSNYSTSRCAQYVNELNSCYNSYNQKKREISKNFMEAKLVPGETNLTPLQLKNLFSKYRL